MVEVLFRDLAQSRPALEKLTVGSAGTIEIRMSSVAVSMMPS